jgi:hypothetical protein
LLKLASLPLLAIGLLFSQSGAQGFPESQPSNRAASGFLSPRNLALGELRFTNARLYNLYDQGGSPMGLLETHPERVGVTLGLLGGERATPGDTLTMGHHDYYIPQFGFFQPGVFGAILYFQRESETFRRKGGDSLEFGASRFGLDLAAGPASGIFRFGFSAHARLGDMDYPGDVKRVVVEMPSLRFDLGSRVHPAVELGVFAGLGGHFDSLKTEVGRLERVATVTLPRYGLLADLGGTQSLPVQGNAVLEFGVERFLGEYKQENGVGIQYPIVWNHYWTLQTQWMYPIQVDDFRLEPAVRFAHRSEDFQGYTGIKGNQNPLKKGDKIDAMKAERGITSFGLGGSFGFREMVSLSLEWETSGHSYKADSTREERYNRYSLGLEQCVEKLPFMHFPSGMSLALRAGWAWRQDGKGLPGYRDYQFHPFVSSPSVPTRTPQLNAGPDDPAGYGAFHLGFGLALFQERLGVDGVLGFPGQVERIGAGRTGDASGTELGLTASYRIMN